MTTYQSGDLYLLDGKSQSLSLYDLPQASIFINGSHSGVTINNLSEALIVMNGSNDGLDDIYSPDIYSPNVTVAMFGHNESIFQHSGSPSLTILGFDASDSLSLYTLLPNPNGIGHERSETPVTAANLHPDGHCGWILPLGSSTSYVDFPFTKEAAILAAHITIGARGL